MASVNKAILIGALGKDPEIRLTATGTVTNFTLATNERYKDKTGEMVERTEWHNVVFRGKLAEIAGEYLTKGRSVYVDGRIHTRKWQDKDGNDRYTTEIVGERLQLLFGRTAPVGE